MEGTMEIHKEDRGHQEGDGAGETTQMRGKLICIRYWTTVSVSTIGNGICTIVISMNRAFHNL